MKLTPLMTMLFTPALTSFVLVEKAGPKLNVSPEQPTAVFYWSSDNSTPSITDKDKIKDGLYSSYSDAELTPLLIQEAMDQWNSVRGSFLKFELQTVSGELPISRTDNTSNIIVKKCASSSIAAYAAPSPLIDDEGKERPTITGDCDIVICSNKFTAQFLASTLTHEIGHCVGLGHPHSNYNAIMSYSRGGDSYRLDADDKAGAIYLYPDPLYADTQSKELIGCGAIRGSSQNKTAPWSIAIILGLPFAMMSLPRRWKRGQ